MKAFVLRLVLVATLIGPIASSQAVERRYQYPRQRSYSGYGVYVKTCRNGQPAYRYTYPGYSSNFPPPAFLYYGYPQSGYSYGIGF